MKGNSKGRQGLGDHKQSGMQANHSAANKTPKGAESMKRGGYKTQQTSRMIGRK